MRPGSCLLPSVVWACGELAVFPKCKGGSGGFGGESRLLPGSEGHSHEGGANTLF